MGELAGLPPPASLERFVTAAELARTLSVSERTVDRWVARGCPSDRWGVRMRRFQVSRVVAWRRAQG